MKVKLLVFAFLLFLSSFSLCALSQRSERWYPPEYIPATVGRSGTFNVEAKFERTSGEKTVDRYFLMCDAFRSSDSSLILRGSSIEFYLKRNSVQLTPEANLECRMRLPVSSFAIEWLDGVVGDTVFVDGVDGWVSPSAADMVDTICLSGRVSYVGRGFLADAEWSRSIEVDSVSPYFTNYNGVALYDPAGTELLCAIFNQHGQSKYSVLWKDGIEAIGNEACMRGQNEWDDKEELSLPASVRRIGDRAFKVGRFRSGTDCYRHGRLTIPDLCEIVGNGAFANRNYDTIVIGRNVRNIGYGAFGVSDYRYRPREVVCKAAVPPESLSLVGGDPFVGFAKHDVRLRVPSGSVGAYKAHWMWKQFDIEGDAALDDAHGPVTALVEASPGSPLRATVRGREVLLPGMADVEVFSLGGVRLFSGRTSSVSIAAPGLYVVTADGAQGKVAIK